MKKLFLILLTATLACLAINAKAAISVTGSGAGPFLFNALPTVADGWSTLSIGTSGATITTAAGLDAAVQLRTAASINTVLGSSATVPPSLAALARWNSAGFYLQSRPTGNDFTLLMATLHNNTGANQTQVTISYDFGALVAAGSTIGESPELFGLRAYYSLTGAANSWTLIPALTTGTAGALNTTVTLSSAWVNTTDMFILWADDNGPSSDTAPTREGAYTIDNFTIALAADTEVAITGNPSDKTVKQGDATSFSVTVTGSSPIYQWQKGNGAGGFVDISGATSATLSIPDAQLVDDNDYKCVVHNNLNTVESTVAHLTVTPDTTAPTVVSALGNWNMTNILVTFSERLDPASFDQFSFELKTADGVTTLSVDSATLMNNTNVLLVTGARIVGTNYKLTVKAGIKDHNANPLAADVVISPLHTEVQLLAISGKAWKYLADGSAAPTPDWITPGFNDTLWSNGVSLFDGKRPTPRTTVPVLNSTAVPVGTQLLLTNLASPFTTNAIASMYFRTHFFFPNSTAGVTAKLHTLWDDGAILYLNSQEANRVRVASSNETFLSYGFTAGPADPIPVEVYDFPLTNINANADNTVAVLLKQVNANSSDITMGVEIIATYPGFFTLGPRLNIAPDAIVPGNVVITWTGGGHLQQTSSLVPPVTWTDVAGDPQNSYSVPAALAVQKFYTLRP